MALGSSGRVAAAGRVRCSVAMLSGRPPVTSQGSDINPLDQSINKDKSASIHVIIVTWNCNRWLMGGGEREPSIGKGLRCHGDRLSIEPLIEYWFHVMQRGVEGGGILFDRWVAGHAP